ncbi:hypothetical protein ACHRV5_01550 [Flavobacterium sp. FlaQc-52]|uniref:hypothetical protein n=1 Tax=Flavobacterium sp. FlaQc-52 TaxID=3374185 RepID=UPI00375650B1
MDITILIEKFDSLAQEVINKAETYSFNIKDLPHVNNYETDIRNDLNFSLMFVALNKKLSSCLYWFEVETLEHCSNLQNLLDQNRELLKSNLRRCPPKKIMLIVMSYMWELDVEVFGKETS